MARGGEGGEGNVRSTTTYCRRCHHLTEVARITAQHIRCYYMRKAEEYNKAHGTQRMVEVQMAPDARVIEAYGECGHKLNFVTSRANIDAMNERIQYKWDMAKEARENAMSETMAT
jgi:uncharacterized protein YwqG